jgi:hypothetical protein
MLGEVHDCGCGWSVPTDSAPRGPGHLCEPAPQGFDTREVQVQPGLRAPQLRSGFRRELLRGPAGAGSNVACGVRGGALQEVRVWECDEAGRITRTSDVNQTSLITSVRWLAHRVRLWQRARFLVSMPVFDYSPRHATYHTMCALAQAECGVV